MSSVKDFQSFMTGDQQLLASSAGIVKNVSLTELYRDGPQGKNSRVVEIIFKPNQTSGGSGVTYHLFSFSLFQP